MKVIFHYQHLAHYHRARLQRLFPVFAREGFDLVPLEIFKQQDVYRWGEAEAELVAHRLDLRRSGPDRMCWSECPRLWRELTGVSPGMVFVNGWGMRDSLAILTWCRFRNVPVVLVSDSQSCDGTRNAIKELFKSLIVRSSAAGFAAGSPHRRYLAALGLPTEKTFLGCDVVDNAHFRNVRRTQLPGVGFSRVLTVARWESRKNLVGAAKAFLKFASQRPSSEAWEWRLVGYGSEEPALRELEARSGGRIRILGYRSYGELPAVYAQADLYWQPSLIEPWGLAVNEAMAAGLPVLVSDRCGCAEDLVTPDTGWAFSPIGEENLVSGLTVAVGDRARWPAMGRAGSARVDQWGLERFVEGAAATANFVRNQTLQARA